MDLAVVIPALNEEHSIGECIASVGTNDGVELIVADGGSDDRTKEIAKGMGALVVIGALGRGPQLNLGAASTSAARLLFLHADCRLPEGWMSALSRVMDDQKVALACFRLRTLSSARSKPSALHRLWLRVFDLRSRGLGLPYGDQGFAVRRAVFEEAGRFPEIPLMEDVSFARACRRLGKVHHLPLEMRTTARRVEQMPLKTIMMLATFPTFFRLGVAPETLARWYGNSR